MEGFAGQAWPESSPERKSKSGFSDLGSSFDFGVEQTRYGQRVKTSEKFHIIQHQFHISLPGLCERRCHSSPVTFIFVKPPKPSGYFEPL